MVIDTGSCEPLDCDLVPFSITMVYGLTIIGHLIDWAYQLKMYCLYIICVVYINTGTGKTSSFVNHS